MTLLFRIGVLLLLVAPFDKFAAVNFIDDARTSPVKFFKLVMTSQPADAVAVIGGQASFTFTFLSGNPALVSFNWQCSLTGGATWADLVETTGIYEGVSTTTLTVKAIDNFLATRPTQFRCRCVFSGSVATFTLPASLTVPIHTNWQGYPWMIALNVAKEMPLPPLVTGFAGPYTYLWVAEDAANVLCADPTIAQPIFTSTGGTTLQLSRWHCTISNGSDSIQTDTIRILGAPDNFQYFSTATPIFSNEGAPITTAFALAPPYLNMVKTSLSYNFRCASQAAPSVAVVNDTNDVRTSFLFGATPLMGGQAVACVAMITYQNSFSPGVDFRFLGRINMGFALFPGGFGTVYGFSGI